MLAEFVGRSRYNNQGQRVVAGQRLMQQASDIFLGWQRTTGHRRRRARLLRPAAARLEGVARRSRTSARRACSIFGEICAWCLARAHARSGDRIAIAGYLGSSAAFEHALADFAERYADLTEGDHRQLAEAVASGRLQAQPDI